jgi:hypothetical protein
LHVFAECFLYPKALLCLVSLPVIKIEYRYDIPFYRFEEWVGTLFVSEKGADINEVLIIGDRDE